MPKKPKPPEDSSVIRELKKYFSARWKMLVLVLGSTAGVFTSIGAISKNWDSVEPNFPSTRGYVRDNVKVAQQSQTSILRDLQIESAEGKRSQASNAVANWKLEKLKTKDPVTQNLIDQQINNQEEEVHRLNEQLRTLNNLKSEGK